MANPTKDGGQSIHDQTIAGFPVRLGTGNGWEEGPGSRTTKSASGSSATGADSRTGFVHSSRWSIDHDERCLSDRVVPKTCNSDTAPWAPPPVGPVTYIGGPAALTGDYNGNGTVDAADYVLWRNGGPLQNDSTPATVGPEDYNVWRANFGKPAPAPVPAWAMHRLCPNPPAGCWHCLFRACCARYAGGERPLRSSAKIVVTCNRFCGGTQWRTSCPREAWRLLVRRPATCCYPVSAFGSTLDRNYQLGDDPQENAVAGQVVGAASALANHTLDTAPPVQFPGFDAKWQPDVRERAGLNRPGVTSPKRGVQFNGTNQYLQGNGLGSPREGASVYGAGVNCQPANCARITRTTA